MPLLQCGFIANGPGEVLRDSKDISSALPVPVAPTAGPNLVKGCEGGWGFGLGLSDDGSLYAWGVNQATMLSKQGAKSNSSSQFVGRCGSRCEAFALPSTSPTGARLQVMLMRARTLQIWT